MLVSKYELPFELAKPYIEIERCDSRTLNLYNRLEKLIMHIGIVPYELRKTKKLGQLHGPINMAAK